MDYQQALKYYIDSFEQYIIKQGLSEADSMRGVLADIIFAEKPDNTALFVYLDREIAYVQKQGPAELEQVLRRQNELCKEIWDELNTS